jgi:DNA mismatch repair protein MutS2
MSALAEQLLEFPRVLEILRRYVTSPMAAAQLDQVRPFAGRSDAERELADAAEAIEWLRETGPGAVPISFGGLHDVRSAAARLSIEGAALDSLDLLHLLELLDRACEVRAALAAVRLRYPRLAALADSLADFRPLLRELSGRILPDGRLNDHASPALRRVRREIEQQKRSVLDSLERFVRAHSEEGSLQEEYVTIRNERLVVPVKVGQKRRIDGVIHATSSTGQTLFVEPLETIDLNNQLVRLAEEESREVHRILREMTERLARATPQPSTPPSTCWSGWSWSSPGPALPPPSTPPFRPSPRPARLASSCAPRVIRFWRTCSAATAAARSRPRSSSIASAAS